MCSQSFGGCPLASITEVKYLVSLFHGLVNNVVRCAWRDQASPMSATCAHFIVPSLFGSVGSGTTGAKTRTRWGGIEAQMLVVWAKENRNSHPTQSHDWYMLSSGQKIARNVPIFNFRPEFCPELLLRIFREFIKIFCVFLGKRRLRIHQESPPFFTTKSPGKFDEETIHKHFLRSRQSNLSSNNYSRRQ